MNKHAHSHSCSCDHANLRFCKTCRVVHCLSCNAEWVTRTQGYWNYPYWNYTALIGNTGYLDGLETNYASVNSDSGSHLQSPSPTTSCTHSKG